MMMNSYGQLFQFLLEIQIIFLIVVLQYYYHHRNAMSISQLLVEAYRLSETTPDDIHPRNVLEDFAQLPKGQYPIFNKYPKFIVDFQVIVIIYFWRKLFQIWKTNYSGVHFVWSYIFMSKTLDFIVRLFHWIAFDRLHQYMHSRLTLHSSIDSFPVEVSSLTIIAQVSLFP